jgi:hypothetical protein
VEILLHEMFNGEKDVTIEVKVSDEYGTRLIISTPE